MQSITHRLVVTGLIAVFVAGCATRAATFNGLDADESGSLSQTEANSAVRNFDSYDENGDGELDPREYAQARQAIEAPRRLERSLPSSSRTGGFGS